MPTIHGDVPHGTGDEGSPVKVGFEARRSNPTAVEDADRVDGVADDIGRQVVWPYQVRDLISTARVSITATGEQALLAGAAGVFHDLLYVTGANESTNAVSVILRDATGGNPNINLELPANDTKVVALPLPYRQNEAGNAWTAQVSEFVNDGTTSNGTVVIAAQFVDNV